MPHNTQHNTSQVHVVADGLLACIDCTIAIANDDYSGMDDTTEARVRAGLARLAKRGYPVIGDEYGFTWHGCDCCHDGLGGDKHEFALLSH